MFSGGISSLPKCSRELRVVFAIDGRSNAQVIGWTWCQGGGGSWKFAGHQKRDSGTHTATWVVVEVDGEMVGIFVKVWVEFGWGVNEGFDEFQNDWPERKRSEWEVVKQSESYGCATWTQDNYVDTISRWKSTWTGWNHLNWHDTRSGTVVSWCSTSLSTSSLDGMVAHGWYHRRVSQKAFCTCTSLSMFTATWVFSWLVVFLRSFPNTILSCSRS